jgi:hypothetical protein
MVCALATGFLKENSRVKEDTVMGVVFSGMFGAGIVMFSMIETELHLHHILFGDMLGTDWPTFSRPARSRRSSSAPSACSAATSRCTPSTPSMRAPSACRCGSCITACSA